MADLNSWATSEDEFDGTDDIKKGRDNITTDTEQKVYSPRGTIPEGEAVFYAPEEPEPAESESIEYPSDW